MLNFLASDSKELLGPWGVFKVWFVQKTARWFSFSHICLFLSATCEMCGMVGVRDAFYSKTKRFCSVSCSRSYSSNSKKASILARLQVETHFCTDNSISSNRCTMYSEHVWVIMKCLHLWHTYKYDHCLFIFGAGQLNYFWNDVSWFRENYNYINLLHILVSCSIFSKIMLIQLDANLHILFRLNGLN